MGHCQTSSAPVDPLGSYHTRNDSLDLFVRPGYNPPVSKQAMMTTEVGKERATIKA
jgi:hypothetical protein